MKVNLSKLSKKIDFNNDENCVFRLIARENGTNKVSKEAIENFFKTRSDEFPVAYEFFKNEGLIK